QMFHINVCYVLWWINTLNNTQNEQIRKSEEAGGSELLYPIGEVARLTGVSQGLLRLWEREGLISPQRTSGGHRFYTSEDLMRLRHIAHLRRVERLNTEIGRAHV